MAHVHDIANKQNTVETLTKAEQEYIMITEKRATVEKFGEIHAYESATEDAAVLQVLDCHVCAISGLTFL